MGRVAQVEPDQLAALRRLRAAFGAVWILEVIDHADDQDQHGGEDGPGPDDPAGAG